MNDFLYVTADYLWGALGRLPHPFLALFLRWASYLSLISLLGWGIRKLAPSPGTPTLICQALAFTVSAAAVLPLTFQRLADWAILPRNVACLAALLAWAILPLLLPRIIIRRRGFQQLTLRILYALEAVLLAVQLAVFLWS